MSSPGPIRSCLALLSRPRASSSAGSRLAGPGVSGRLPTLARGLSIALPAALYFALSCALTWPLITCLDTRLAGALGSDVFCHVWMHWISREALLDSGMLPFRIATDQLYWPAGGTIHSSDPIGSLLSIPMQSLVGLVASYNLLVLANLTFSATAMFALARRVTHSDLAGFIAGLAFGFSPFVLAEVNNGSPELLTGGWLPLLVLCLSRLASTKGWTGVLPTTAVLVLASLFTWYFAIAACLLLFVHCLFPVELHDAPALPFRTRLPKYIAVLGLSAIVVAPFLASFIDSISGPSALVYGDSRQSEHALEQPHLSVDVLALLSPFSPSFQILGFRLPSYLGLVGTAFAAIGVVARRRGRLFWLVAAVTSLLFAVGPILVADGAHVGNAGRYAWMPFALLSKVLPFLHSVHSPRRLLIVTILAIAVLAAIGLRRLMASVPKRWAMGVACALGMALLADSLLTRQVPVPIPTTSASVADVYHTLAAMPGEGAILEVPILTGNNRLAPLYAQTVHARPIQIGLPWEGPWESYCAPPLREMGVVQWLVRRGQADVPTVFPTPSALADMHRDLELLEAMGFSHILAHTHEYAPDRAHAATSLLDQLLGPGDRTWAPFVLYSLTPALVID